jgi:diguanylate cyclase (GGDEF)-like protein
MEREKVVARLDFLTGIPNGKAFYEAAEAEIHRCRRNPYPISFAYLDCDNFKTINDDFGHHTGDTVLREMAEVIKKNVRASDVAARMGGDEYVILMPQAGAEAARQVITRLQALLTQAMGEKGWPLTFSIGLATFLAPPASPDEMIKHADRLMYLVKRTGRKGLKHEVIG